MTIFRMFERHFHIGDLIEDEENEVDHDEYDDNEEFEEIRFKR